MLDNAICQLLTAYKILAYCIVISLH